MIAAGSMFWDLNVAWDPKRAAAFADLALRPVRACMRLEGLGNPMEYGAEQGGSAMRDAFICNMYTYHGPSSESISK